LKVIETLSLIAQRPIKIAICPRRPGDLGCVVCSAEKAEKELGWQAERGIVEMCRDLVNWQAVSRFNSVRRNGCPDEWLTVPEFVACAVQLNPNGYQSAPEVEGAKVATKELNIGGAK
jgi:hypothetical protein